MTAVTKTFGDVAAVRDLDLTIMPGEVVTLIGPSGCGKTTTLRLVAGLEQPDSGEIRLGGNSAVRLPTEKRGVGFVFQDYALFPHLTVRANVGFGLHRLPRSQRRGVIDQTLRMVGLTNLGDKLPRELSGGQQQRVALARALAPRPGVLLLDEPFSNLDPELRRHVRHEVLSIIRKSGSAALWVTHDRDEGLIVADRVVLMENGSVRQAGSPSDLWNRPADAWVAGFIGHGDLVAARVSQGFASTELGPVAAPGLPEGSAVKVLVRPEDVIIDPKGARGTVVRRHFSGSDNVYCVELESGGLLHCKQPSGVEISRGTEVTVKLASEALPVFA